MCWVFSDDDYIDQGEEVTTNEEGFAERDDIFQLFFNLRLALGE